MPKVVEILPFHVQETIMNAEIKRAKNDEDFNINKPFDLQISDKEFLTIVSKLKTRDDLKFHLKNATRAHMLQFRLDIESNKKANKIIKLLETIK